MRAYLTPLAIVIGFALVAAAIYVRGFTFGDPQPQLAAAQPVAVEAQVTGEPRRAENRRVYGSDDAPVTIVEFSDLECPYCLRLHPTLKQLVDESNGQINWEYRHLPLPMHPNAEPAARASECVAELVGNDAFWTFIDRLFSEGDYTNIFYTSTAVDLGAEPGAFQSCMDDPAIAARVATDAAVAGSLGGSGTPFSVIVHADGRKTPIRGALPYDMWQAALQ